MSFWRGVHGPAIVGWPGGGTQQLVGDEEEMPGQRTAG
jgi:hypothetical protein